MRLDWVVRLRKDWRATEPALGGAPAGCRAAGVLSSHISARSAAATCGRSCMSAGGGVGVGFFSKSCDVPSGVHGSWPKRGFCGEPSRIKSSSPPSDNFLETQSMRAKKSGKEESGDEKKREENSSEIRNEIEKKKVRKKDQKKEESYQVISGGRNLYYFAQVTGLSRRTNRN